MCFGLLYMGKHGHSDIADKLTVWGGISFHPPAGRQPAFLSGASPSAALGAADWKPRGS